ncbi:class I SAM-dependent methyltransferase [Candidatus Palauibacter polyketidifaciens]|uniref:class I SAM-dependent methyltransferase n=1 Tax=Candidatus Palauibacter polyketidifaciens TaxID=3056740 RepID=UPI00139B362A|nr:class I SAM-dependent methyltransferase [Candidatus Palauibacter polyketidifaciens]MDE2721378.1 class I SAM-dependent methyltransferase [Candidatus Palauibacter polyketidifaciens]MYE33574.1 class I SAM-dependent methyltransferase [Gemmatimonadales bacterium]
MTSLSSQTDLVERDYYEDFLASREYRESRLRKAAVLDRIVGDRIRAGGTIGDVGSGTGLLKRELEKLSGQPIIGFEVDPRVVIERGRTCVADGTRLPTSDACFDFLIVNHLYEHVADPRRLFAEVSRVLKPGGSAYVSAGSRWAVLEPHYRLPFLSWLPRGMADRYVRWTGRARDYRGIRFLGYRSLQRAMAVPDLLSADMTEHAIRSVLSGGGGGTWRSVWRILSVLPAGLRRRILRCGPQWFFLLTRRDR